MSKKTLKESNFFYGWIVVLMGALALFFSGPGQTYSNALFIDQYIEDFGWSRSTVSTVYSSATLVSGLTLFSIGRLIDKYSFRVMAVIIGILLTAACFFNSFIVNIYMLFAGFFLLRLFGQGSMTLLPNTLVPQWFIMKRGRALSLMTLGGVASSSLFPIMNSFLINSYGWRVTWMILGISVLVIFVPLAFFFIRNTPEEEGLLPDGTAHPKEDSGFTPPIERAVSISEDWTFQEAKKTRVFKLLLSCVGIPAMINTGITFHLTSIFTSNGVDSQYAAVALSLMALIGFPVTFAAGIILEKIEANKLLAVVFINEMILLVLLLFTRSIPAAILFAVIWGITVGAEKITLNIIWPNYFGRASLGSIRGLASTMMVIGSAFGPLPFGLAFDFFHSYTQILLLSLIFPLFGAVAAWTSKKPERSDYIGD